MLIRMFGLSETTLVAYPFAISILGCLLAYSLARHLESPLAGLIALGGLAVLPIELSMASTLFPDAIAAFWANVGVALAVVAFGRPNLRQSMLLGVLSGLFFGASWLCKESVVYLVPFVAILAFIHHWPSRLPERMACLMAIGIGSLSVLLTEAAFYGRFTGDPLFRLHETERNYKECAVWFFSWESGGYTKALIKRLFADGPKVMLLSREYCYVPSLALLGSAWAFLFQRRSIVVPSIWLISLMAMFNFMSTSLSSYMPMPLANRYLYAIALPSAVLLGCFLAKLIATESDFQLVHERRFWAVTLIVFLCVASGSRVKSYMHKSHPVERAVASRLGKQDVVYTDHRSAGNLAFFRSGSLTPSTDTTLAWENETRSTIPEGSYVLVNDNILAFLSSHYNYTPPDFAREVPSEWEKESTYPNASLYVVRGK
jgi:MFS family permease